MERQELKQMIADYMEKGFLENIIDMFKHDPSLYEMIGDLIKDERMRVKLGITALMEELSQQRPEDVKRALPFLYPLLEDENPTVRGDAANLIGIIGDPEGISKLRPLLQDKNPQVVEVVREFLVY
ncbi:MAG: HEAT repeat domain-containing protein [Nitrospirae bacterium]|nr:MAG: HEAT repeat domain-containing protein [Nitrospirota bacterium]